MKFRRGYLQDEVRETQNEMQKVQIVEQKLALGLITVEGAGRYLKIDEEEIERAQAQKEKRDEAEVVKSGMLKQNLNNNDDVIKERDAKNKAKTKQTTQNNNQQNAGGKKINP